MAKWMNCKGVGSRFSILVRGTTSKRGGLTRSLSVALFAASALSASLGCSTSESEPASSQPAALAERVTGGPEQVVQRMAPEPTSAASSGDRRAAVERPADARLSAAGVTRADSRPSSPGEPITSKHLEAELNRLEAELDN
jgi:hypothetical protein